MHKKDFFNHILTVVECETEVGREILQGPMIKTREAVDARYLLIYFLNHKHFAGFDSTYIAHTLGMTPQGVRKIINTFDDRKEQSGKIFEITFERIKNTLETNRLI